MNEKRIQFHRIVVGIDGSDTSLATLDWAAHQAELTGSTLEILITWDWPLVGFGAMCLPADYDPAADAATVLENAMHVAQRDHPEVLMHSSVREGRAAQFLVEASREADLLVVGTHGRGELSAALLGSVSEDCAHHASCPVVIIRH